MDQHEDTNPNEDDLYVYDDSEEDSEDEDVAPFRARFVSKPEKPETKVERGRTATLECAVNSLGGGTIMWERNNFRSRSKGDYLYVGKKQMHQEGRKYGIELLKEEGYKGSKLIIRGTNNSDTGYYLCTETASQPPQKQWHYLRVKEPGEFVIYGILDPREQMNKSMSISTEGVTHRITCSFTDRDAKIRWTRGNERKTFSDNPDLRIHSRKDSGIYVCHADSHKKTVEVIVQYQPEVMIEQIHLTSQQGRREYWVRCEVHSSPAAVVTWARDGKVLAEGEKGFVQEVEGSKHTLQIASSLGEAAMGIFSCDATTNLGSVVETTRVTGAQCNDPRPLDRSLELVFSDLEDATVKVELCSNDDTSLNSKAKVNVDKASPHFGPETSYPDYKPNLPETSYPDYKPNLPETSYPDYKPNLPETSYPDHKPNLLETSYPDYKPKKEYADGWNFEETAQPDDDGTRDMFPISTYEYTHPYDPYDNLLSKTCINNEGTLSNCSSHVRTTLATTAGKTTHFVVTSMARTPTNASTEIFSIVPLEKEDIADKANYNFHDRFNNSLESFSSEDHNYSNDSTKIYQHPTDVYLNREMQDIFVLNNTALNSTVEGEHLPTIYDKTYTLSNWTATKTTEAPLPVLHELNHSSGYITINPNGTKFKENLPLIYGLNQTSNDITGEGEETNRIIEQADRRDVDKPDVYFENNANEVDMGEEGSKAEEVRLNGTSSRTHGGDLADNEMADENSKKTNNPEEAEQTRTSSKNATSTLKKEVEATKRAAADEKNSKLDADHSVANGSREVKGSDSKNGEKKKESKRLMSSPWILILTILFLFILACIILAVLR